jgi:predicted amidohydrolase YtcJ
VTTRLSVCSGALAIVLALLPAPGFTAPARIYTGGDILTMRGPRPEYAEALVVRQGRIAYVGPRAGAAKVAGAGAVTVDLAGRTLVPGFIDSHAHLVYAAHTMLDADLTGAKDIAEVLARLKAHMAEVPDGQRIVGMGYRADQLAERRHPTAAELDSVSATRPIQISDGSGHHGVFNTALMKELNLSAETVDPVGGFYDRKPGSRELLGHAAEAAWMAVIATRAPLDEAQTRKGVAKAVALFASTGVTTACEMGLGLSGDDIPIVTRIVDEKLLPIDLVLFAKASASERIIDAAYHIAQSRTETGPALLAGRPGLDRRYINRVRLAGVKFWMDGSIDTMYLSRPFTHNPPGVTTENYRGTRVDPQDDLIAALGRYWKSNRQIAGHAIGDEANDQFLQAIEQTIKAQGMADARPIFQHAQLLRPDQIPRLKAVGGIPSFTTGGLYPMGEYVASLVPDRVDWAIAANSVQRAGIRWTINTDWPAGVSPNLMFAVWNAVNRVAKSGKVLVPAERVDPYDAMRALTANAAYQYKEERTKGTLQVGKLADLVILDRNPLKVEPMTIKDISVLETIKEGATVYKKGDAATAALYHEAPLNEDAPIELSAPAPTEGDRRVLAQLAAGLFH